MQHVNVNSGALKITTSFTLISDQQMNISTSHFTGNIRSPEMVITYLENKLLLVSINLIPLPKKDGIFLCFPRIANLSESSRYRAKALSLGDWYRWCSSSHCDFHPILKTFPQIGVFSEWFRYILGTTLRIMGSQVTKNGWWSKRTQSETPPFS